MNSFLLKMTFIQIFKNCSNKFKELGPKCQPKQNHNIREDQFKKNKNNSLNIKYSIKFLIPNPILKFLLKSQFKTLNKFLPLFLRCLLKFRNYLEIFIKYGKLFLKQINYWIKNNWLRVKV